MRFDGASMRLGFDFMLYDLASEVGDLGDFKLKWVESMGFGVFFGSGFANPDQRGVFLFRGLSRKGRRGFRKGAQKLGRLRRKGLFEATCRQSIAPIVAAARCFVSEMGMQRLQRIAGLAMMREPAIGSLKELGIIN